MSITTVLSIVINDKNDIEMFSSRKSMHFLISIGRALIELLNDSKEQFEKLC